MPLARRYSLAGGISLLIHGVAILWGAWRLEMDFEFDPDLDFEFETVEWVDPNALQGQEPPAPQEVVVPPTIPTPEVPPGDTEKAPEEQPPPKKKFGGGDSKIDGLAPTNATFTLMLANRRIAKLPFAEDAADIMAPQPDFAFLVQGGGFDPWRDFAYIVIASTDIRDLTQTFLAVEYTMGAAELKAGLARAAKADGQVLEWQMRSGVEVANPRPADPNVEDWDPRWVVLLDEKRALYIREEFLPHALGEVSVEGAKTSGNFVANVSRLRRFAQAEPRAGLQMVAKDLRSALKRTGKLPFEFPDSLEVMAEAAREPELVIKLEFLTAAHAQTFEDFWNGKLKDMIDDNLQLRLTIGSDFAATELERDDRRIVLRNRFNEAKARFVLGLIADGMRKMTKRTKEEIQAMREERARMRELREGGKLSASEALRKTEPKPPAPEPQPSGEPEPDPSADPVKPD